MITTLKTLPLADRLEEYRSIFIHRWRLVLLVSLALATALCAIVWIIPNAYEASTTILDYPRKVPEKYVAATVSDDSLDRLALMQQEILSYTRLLEVIHKLNLYPRLIASQTPDEAVSEFRKQIRIQTNHGGTNGPSAFTITFTGDDPKTAAAVANELARSFILKNLANRQQQVEDTVSFISAQLDQARSGLQQQEDQLRVFRMSHLGQMPDQAATNLQAIGQMQAQFQAVSDKLAQLDDQELLIRESPLSNPSLRAGNSSSAAAVLSAELSQEKLRLADLLTHLTPQHPDVLASQEKIADLSEQLKALPTQAATPAESRDTDAHIQAIAEQRQHLLAEQATIRARLDSYQDRVDAVPLRQEQLSSLTRDYDTARDHYRSLLDKYYSAEMASELEEKQDADRFEVLDPAIVPAHPSSPNRPVLWGASAVFALLAGFLAAFGIERLDDRIKSEIDLRKVIPHDLEFAGAICSISADGNLFPRRLFGTD